MTPATEALAAAGIVFDTIEYVHDPTDENFGDEAAEATGTDPGRIFKTLVVQTSDDEMVVALVPVNASLNLKALARAAGAKRAGLAEAADAERRTGYMVGGISPFGQRQRHRTFVDHSANEFDSIFVSGGRRGLEIVLHPDAFGEVLDANFVDLAATPPHGTRQ
ncbi:MAG: Cys-tRNA(Pro) deacylase [Acidimicrobiales bacterium]